MINEAELREKIFLNKLISSTVESNANKDYEDFLKSLSSFSQAQDYSYFAKIEEEISQMGSEDHPNSNLDTQVLVNGYLHICNQKNTLKKENAELNKEILKEQKK